MIEQFILQKKHDWHFMQIILKAFETRQNASNYLRSQSTSLTTWLESHNPDMLD